MSHNLWESVPGLAPLTRAKRRGSRKRLRERVSEGERKKDTLPLQQRWPPGGAAATGGLRSVKQLQSNQDLFFFLITSLLGASAHWSQVPLLSVGIGQDV